MINGYPYVPTELPFWAAMAAAYVAGGFSVWLMWHELRRAIVGALVLVVVVFAAWSALAHDHGRPGLDAWFKSLTSRAKAACCDGTDATRLDDVDWESKGGRYRVRIEGQWIDVPESAVVDGPNRAGPAMVWPVTGWQGLTIRCFMPGALS